MKTILIGTDFSMSANNAVNYGTDLAKYLDARIVLVHAFNLPLGGYNSMAPLTAITEIRTSSLKTLMELRTKMLDRLNTDSSIECFCEIGSFNDVIVMAIDKFDATMVVMGMVGNAGPIKKHLIGSSSVTAARHLKIPLFIIQEHVVCRKINRVTFACDVDSGMDIEILDTAKSVTKMLNAELEIVSVRKERGEANKSPAIPSYIENTEVVLKHNTILLNNDEPAEVLQEYFKGRSTDVVMLNPKKHSLFDRIFLPTTTNKLLFTLEQPIIIIH